MHAILIHGMGRTPLSMLLLAARLRLAGMRPKLFGYCAAIEGWHSCTGRLARFIEGTGQHEYIVIGHSLGAVLARAVLPALRHSPQACFLIAPPSVACKAACHFSHSRFFRWFTGEMGLLLANHRFMAALPRPNVPTKIYAGTGGTTGRLSPFGNQSNDGILALRESVIPHIPVIAIPSIHTFIMNSRVIAQDIVSTVSSTAGGHK
jgi:hypothetical protein